MPFALINARVLLESGFNERLAVVVENGIITALLDASDSKLSSMTCYDCTGNSLLPGFIDVQVNGGGGVLFNDEPSVAGIARIARAHRHFGTTGFLPTLISDDLDVIAQAMAAADDAVQQQIPGILGVHIEGPYISTERKGTHNEAKFRALDQSDVTLLSSMRYGKTLVTLAPERNSTALIADLVNAGVIVSAGHTNATYVETMRAVQAGLTGFTHLFNAMSPLTNREPGTVGAALHHQHSWCGIIVDGFHVDPVTLAIALRCKPLNRFMLVTDAMSNLGTDAKEFMLQGKKITIRDGKCVDSNGILSGSALDMASAVRNATHMLNLPLAEAARMASTYPAEFLGLGDKLGKIAVGYQADMVLVDSHIKAIRTWIKGQSLAS